MLPVLRQCADSKEHSLRELIELLAKEFSIGEDERRELLPSGRQPVFDNRVGWARTYLKKAGLLDSTRRGYVAITERGQIALLQFPDRIDNKSLEQFPEFIEFQNATRTREAPESDKPVELDSSGTPEEVIEFAFQQMRETLASEILDRIKKCSPAFFEQVVVELLVAMGYGGSLKDAGQRVGKRGDGGIDGIIKEDQLGLDVLYIQAKRWEGTVGRPDVQKFVGALQGQRARKGVFITTSGFTREAVDYALNLESKVILIDGKQFSLLMFDYGLGVSPVAEYKVKRLDGDFFSEE
jgi:restriction system protein